MGAGRSYAGGHGGLPMKLRIIGTVISDLSHAHEVDRERSWIGAANKSPLSQSRSPRRYEHREFSII